MGNEEHLQEDAVKFKGKIIRRDKAVYLRIAGMGDFWLDWQLGGFCATTKRIIELMSNGNDVEIKKNTNGDLEFKDGEFIFMYNAIAEVPNKCKLQGNFDLFINGELI